MTTPQLTQWLRDNSAGIYRPAAEAADLIESLTSQLAHARQQAAAGNALYETITERVSPHFPRRSRELEWDVLPGTMGALAARDAKHTDALERIAAYDAPDAHALIGIAKRAIA